MNLSSRTIYNLAHGLPGNGDFPHSSTELRSLSVNRTGAINVKRLHTPRAMHFQEEAPRLFRGVRFQTKAPQLSCKILSSLTQPGRLMVKLLGNRAKTSDLIFIRKIRCFLKIKQFRSFFLFPDRSSTRDNLFQPKTTGFHALSNLSTRKLPGKRSKCDALTQ